MNPIMRMGVAILLKSDSTNDELPYRQLISFPVFGQKYLWISDFLISETDFLLRKVELSLEAIYQSLY